jgi:hypothetical protein
MRFPLVPGPQVHQGRSCPRGSNYCIERGLKSVMTESRDTMAKRDERKRREKEASAASIPT